MNRLRNPLGIEDFKKARERGCYYVDKTPHLRQLIDQGEHYFLSRPRRFGKSMLISTLENLFESNESLFKGLDIYDHWDWSVKNPVVRLNFSGLFNESGFLASNLISQLHSIEKYHGVKLDAASESENAPDRLRRLLEELHQKTGEQVVVLVDEYDKPILDVLDKPDLARENRDYLRGFYGVIKTSAKHVRFVFVTGISMFSRVSLFSGLNNLRDISIDSRYAAICGYTDADLDAVFAPELEGFDRDKIREWYNGYNWLGDEKLYNPYDILSLFDTQIFDSHWFVTSQSNLLYQVMMQRQFTPLDVENLSVDSKMLSKFDVDDISAEALMFQTGYLTITGKEKRAIGGFKYHLYYPNYEVQMCINDDYLSYLWGPGNNVPEQVEELWQPLVANDFDETEKMLKVIFSDIPNEWQTNSKMARYEGWYASIIFMCLRFSGGELRAEESSSRGRSDIVFIHNKQVFVIECKMLRGGNDPVAAAEGAIRQILEQGYADKYRRRGQKMHLMAMVFSETSRNLEQMLVKPYD